MELFEEYHRFLKEKKIVSSTCGFCVKKESLNRNAFDWQKDIVIWALKKGKAALFEDCGLGKTLQQLMWAEKVAEHTKKPVLVFAPCSVVCQTVKEGQKFGITAKAVRQMDDIENGINITNYEIAEHFEMQMFGGVVLDESSILKDFTSKTKQTLVEMCKCVPYRLCCTATPSPNDYTELGNHAEFLDVMSRTEMLCSFFVHDGGDTSSWRLKGHAADAFFEWVASWACCMTNPSDLGYSGEEYKLPALVIREHIVKSSSLEDSDGQLRLYCQTVQTLNERRSARRNSLVERCRTAADIANSTDEQCLVWCDLNDESMELAKIIKNCVEVKGSDSEHHKASAMSDFTEKNVKCLVSKPSIAGWGMNWQQCHRMVFVGLSDSFEAYYQAVRRCWRFGQKQPVYVDIVISDAEGAVKANIEKKQSDAVRMTCNLVKHTKTILKAEIQSTERMTETYLTTVPMKLPAWIGGSAA